MISKNEKNLSLMKSKTARKKSFLEKFTELLDDRKIVLIMFLFFSNSIFVAKSTSILYVYINTHRQADRILFNRH